MKKGPVRNGRVGSGSTGLTEIIEELSMTDPGSPMVLDTEELEKHNEGRNRSEANDEIKLSPQTANDRLRQARNFLSHVDANRYVEFASGHEKIDKFLQRIANEKVGCDLSLYNEVRAMVQVHRSRMNGPKAQNIERPESSSRRSQSARLSLFDTSKQGHLLGAPLRDDHPPFTLERPEDQNLFIKALHGPPASRQLGGSAAKDRRVELIKFEQDGFLETMKNPSLVHEWLEERESQTRDERFNARATKRGRRRAAIRMALRSFATNCEQHYQGRWDMCDFRLPSFSVTQNSGRKIVFDKTTNAQKGHEGPFPWTRKYQRFLQVEKDRPQDRKEGSLQEFARPLNGNQPIATKKQAMDLLRAEILKESQQNKQRVEATNDKDWASPASKTSMGKPFFSLNRWSGTAPKSTAGNSTKTNKASPENLVAENLAAPGPREVGEKYLVPEKSLIRRNSDGQGDAQIREKLQIQGKSQVREKSQVQEKSQIQRGSRRDQGLSEIAKSQENFSRGGTTFTFAETPFLQTVTSKWIERDLGSGMKLIPHISLIKTEFEKPDQSQNTYASKAIQLPSQKFSLPEPAYTPREGWFVFLSKFFSFCPNAQRPALDSEL